MSQPRDVRLNLAYREHGRRWQDFVYCYPVISRRSRGLSVGVNLNPDKACNFDCVYCQVDRTTNATVTKVDLAELSEELEALLDQALDGSLFRQPTFDVLAPSDRVVRDIAFSGDGEPTTYPRFAEAVQIAADAKAARGLSETKLVLITDACYLTRPHVRAGLAILDANNGEIWAKLDAGTEAYYQAVNRPNYPLAHVMANIIDAARARPVVTQSLFMRLHGAPPPDTEIIAYCDRLNQILDAGGAIKLVQLYTIARQTTEPYATMLSNAELDAIAATVEARVSAPIARFYGVAT
jgi:wyosine [tRNA(Phe)-imidazoG37] synthetase (radical SAM superfamily)